MTRFAIALLCALGLFPHLACAQTPATSQFAYCTVTDQGNHDIWASQVFEFSIPDAPNAWFTETQRMATEFHTHVGTLGGAGAKLCVNGMSRQELEATRAENAANMTKRFLGVRLFKWRDVQWTPGPPPADASAVANAPVNRFVYCWEVDTDSRKMVTTNIFNVTMPPAASTGYLEESARIQREFNEHLAATHGFQGGMCSENDTRAEAEKSRADYLKQFRLASVKKIEESWQPSAPTSMSATNAIAPARPVPSARPTPPDTGDIESDYWNRIVSSQHADDFDDYLKAFPEGKHAALARLEAKRLRRDGTTAAVAGREVASTASQDATSAIIDSIRQQLASDPFFKIPAAEGYNAPLRRAGSRMIGSIPVNSTYTLERLPDSNLCSIDTDVVAGSGAATAHNASKGITWAGFIPLGITSHMGTFHTTYRVQRIDELIGQPFPLVAGQSFSLSFTGDNIDAAGATRTDKFMWSCEVGATGPANGFVPGMPGDQTELKCTMSFGDKAIPSQKYVLQWFGAAGCFAQDPTRP